MLEKISEEEVFSGKIFSVVHQKMSDGAKTQTREIAKRSPGVRIIIPQDGKILISKEFRHEKGDYDYRLPGGKVYDTLEEYKQKRAHMADIEAAIRREAEEEVGIHIKEVEIFGRSVLGATVERDLVYAVVKDFELTEKKPERGEKITHERIDYSTIEKMCLDGSISEERSALQLLRFIKQ